MRYITVQVSDNTGRHDTADLNPRLSSPMKEFMKEFLY